MCLDHRNEERKERKKGDVCEKKGYDHRKKIGKYDYEGKKQRNKSNDSERDVHCLQHEEKRLRRRKEDRTTPRCPQPDDGHDASDHRGPKTPAMQSVALSKRIDNPGTRLGSPLVYCLAIASSRLWRQPPDVSADNLPTPLPSDSIN